MIIVRSVGERTTAKCIKRLGAVVVVENVTPFAEALRKSFELAIASKDRHLICVDADVLPGKKLVNACTQALNKDPKAYAVVPRVKDKLSGKVRPVGVHAYNARWLTRALRQLDEVANSPRPESQLRHRMGKRVIKLRGPYGSHGFEQYYRDIYRTVLFWRIKHGKREAEWLKYWSKQGDADFRVAMRAWQDGGSLEMTTPDASIAIDYEAILKELGLQEKQPL